ncbi:hypothetical protein GCM10023189_37220 [Nibrella saemangeumensis]|uniref:DUF4238 domain-containing protein n=1 Tax=Nibrella saemangeumensis TaxID=1084526 RepID=A0ABP8N883_9BACT
MAAISRKHHYLPEFYLKGFTGEDGKLAVFDIENNRLKTKRLTPSQIFFEYDRNTLEFDGVKDDFVEKMYSQLETIVGHAFKKIKEQKSFSYLDAQDMFRIILFAGSLYWRIPKTDNLIKSEFENSSPDELYFEIRNKITGEKAPEDFINIIKKNDAFIKSYRAIKPVLDYMHQFDVSKIEDWKVYYATINDKGERKELHLIGDNPIIFRNPSNTDIFHQEIIMPLSCGKTLYHTRGKDVKVVEPTARIDVDRILFLQSKKYVCGPDGSYLEKIAEHASLYKDISPQAAEFLRNRVFDVFYDNTN